MNDKPIGIFDSGMGGLTVMRALTARLPDESFIYLGDTARLPYGTKSAETVRRYALQASRALVERGVKLVVVACNTASAVAVPDLTAAFTPIPVIGVIEPGAEAACRFSADGLIAVIATEGTVRGGAYARAIKSRSWRASVIQRACPLFVPLAEEGLVDGPIPESIARYYLDPIFSPPIYLDPMNLKQVHRPECLVLGCTHFPVLKQVIERVIGANVAIVDSAVTTAEAVTHLLADANLANDGAVVPPRFLVTDAPERFVRVGEIFFGRAIDPEAVELVDLQ
jgi:glutamate racemase